MNFTKAYSVIYGNEATCADEFYLAAKIIADNARDLAFMEENIRDGVMVEESRACADALYAQMVEAKRALSTGGVFAA